MAWEADAASPVSRPVDPPDARSNDPSGLIAYLALARDAVPRARCRPHGPQRRAAARAARSARREAASPPEDREVGRGRAARDGIPGRTGNGLDAEGSHPVRGGRRSRYDLRGRHRAVEARPRAGAARRRRRPRHRARHRRAGACSRRGFAQRRHADSGADRDRLRRTSIRRGTRRRRSTERDRPCARERRRAHLLGAPTP